MRLTMRLQWGFWLTERLQTWMTPGELCGPVFGFMYLSFLLAFFFFFFFYILLWSSGNVLWNAKLHLTSHQHHGWLDNARIFWVNCSFKSLKLYWKYITSFFLCYAKSRNAHQQRRFYRSVFPFITETPALTSLKHHYLFSFLIAEDCSLFFSLFMCVSWVAGQFKALTRLVAFHKSYCFCHLSCPVICSLRGKSLVIAL